MEHHREYVEIEIKSVLNRVTGMPFRWSINPYRGCRHACPFCVSGDTLVSMADGTARRMEHLRAGDVVYGTARSGARRRCVPTPVLAHWQVEKAAYRVVLGDGTTLVASGDHRFLTDRGWKHVADGEPALSRRPHLTTNDKLPRPGGLFSSGRGERRAVEGGTPAAVRAVESVGVRRLFDITTGTGDFIANGVVSHNCYARRTHWFLEEDGVDRWSSRIFVKVNAPEVLRRELARPAWRREQVALGTATDPYQAIEGRYRISRRMLEGLRDFRTPVGIVTRSPLIRRDLDVLRGLAQTCGATVCLSVATVDPHMAREIEPGAAPPLQRLRTVRLLTDAGIRAGVLLAPILPGLTDDPRSLAAVVRAAREHGAQFVGHTALHLGPVTRESFMCYLAGRHPDLLRRYDRMYTGKYAPAAYRAEIARIVEAAKAGAGIVAARYLAPAPEPEQLHLDL